MRGALAYLECRLHSAEEAGDHTIFIAEVEEVVVREGDPLLFFRESTSGSAMRSGGDAGNREDEMKGPVEVKRENYRARGTRRRSCKIGPA